MRWYAKNTLSDWAVLAGAAVVALIVLGLIGLLIGQVVFELKHPCVRWGAPRTCEGSTWDCAMRDANGNCMVYTSDTYTYDCTPCVERKMTKGGDL